MRAEHGEVQLYILRVLWIVRRLRPENFGPISGKLQSLGNVFSKLDLRLPAKLLSADSRLEIRRAHIMRVNDQAPSIPFMIGIEVDLFY